MITKPDICRAFFSVDFSILRDSVNNVLKLDISQQQLDAINISTRAIVTCQCLVLSLTPNRDCK